MPDSIVWMMYIIQEAKQRQTAEATSCEQILLRFNIRLGLSTTGPQKGVLTIISLKGMYGVQQYSLPSGRPLYTSNVLIPEVPTS